MWRQVLAFVEQQTMKIRYLDIVKLDIVGIHAWDLAMGLENFVVDFVSDTMYKKRKQLCGGEPNNGFELWRRLFADN